METFTDVQPVPPLTLKTSSEVELMETWDEPFLS